MFLNWYLLINRSWGQNCYVESYVGLSISCIVDAKWCAVIYCSLLADGLDGLPEPQSMRVENKMFYFDVGQNRRGVFMRVSEVFNFKLLKASWAGGLT